MGVRGAHGRGPCGSVVRGRRMFRNAEGDDCSVAKESVSISEWRREWDNTVALVQG